MTKGFNITEKFIDQIFKYVEAFFATLIHCVVFFKKDSGIKKEELMKPSFFLTVCLLQFTTFWFFLDRKTTTNSKLVTEELSKFLSSFKMLIIILFVASFITFILHFLRRVLSENEIDFESIRSICYYSFGYNIVLNTLGLIFTAALYTSSQSNAENSPLMAVWYEFASILVFSLFLAFSPVLTSLPIKKLIKSSSKSKFSPNEFLLMWFMLTVSFISLMIISI